MIPLRSSERTYSAATVTLVLILVNVLIFIFEVTIPNEPSYENPGGLSLNQVILSYGIVPDRFHFSTLITSMFLHGGFLHVAGNMWFLWVFGKGIEDLLGHARFLIFYLACGLVAGLGHVLANPYSPVPTIGASGAIAGVMGAYLIKFPHARIVTLVPIVFFITTLDLPAAFLLLYWFAIQFFSGVGSVGYSQVSKGDVAWFAHVAGFVAGMLFVLMIPARQRYRWGS
ncbi:MAG: rhomboid family intramembrane serine protease [Acidobacteriota bacterium]|nr:rhomboid family intramembrane serine protease [Acidobacteriota bacterium]